MPLMQAELLYRLLQSRVLHLASRSVLALS